MNDKENYINLRNRKVYRGGSVIKKEKQTSSIIMNNTDMVFLMSDYLGDRSSLNFFNTQKSYLTMLEKYPKRYKVKKEIAYEKLKHELDKWNAYIYYNSSNLIWIRIPFPGSNSYTDIKVVYHNEEVCMKAEKELFNFRHNNEIVEAFKNYFESCM
jgi:hypothetical protein